MARMLLPSTGREVRLGILRIGGLGFLLWGCTQQESPGWTGWHVVSSVLLVLATGGWLTWAAGFDLPPPARVRIGSITVMGLAGGAVIGAVPAAMTFSGMAAMAAGMAFPLEVAGPIAGASLAAEAISSLAAGRPWNYLAVAALIVGLGLLLGATQRSQSERAAQAEALLAEQERAEAEKQRAATLAERNRIGQEIHDVLAHSLGALAVQLAAADALLGKGTEPEKARELVQRSRALAVEGLEETRRAVQALREDPIPLADQVRNLAALDEAELDVSGPPRSLPPAAGLAVYRAAQEAMSNARKHAPGAPVRVSLDFGQGCTTLVVANGGSAGAPGALASTGGGYGLAGMRERIEKAGGSFHAGPVEGGFRVEVSVPA